MATTVNLGNVIGPQGEVGPSNVINIGTVTTGAPGEQAAATMEGESPSQTLNLTLPRGATGYTPRISIGDVTTLDPGEQASVEVTGTAEEPVFNMSLPKGDQGIQGPQGEVGPMGPPVPIDTVISDTSINAVQSKVVKEYIDSILGDINSILATLVDGEVIPNNEEV